MSKEEKIIKQFPKLPMKKIEKWILDKVVQNAYIIYDSKNDFAFCTRCQKKMSIHEDLSLIKHNGTGICPKCGEIITFKAEGRGRKGLIELTRVLVFHKKGNSIFGELAEINIKFEGLIPTIEAWGSAIYKFNSKEQIYIERLYSNFYGERYIKRNKVNLPSIPSGGYGLPPKRQGTHIYTENFKNLFDNTDLKYADVDKMHTEYALDAYDLIRYLDLSLKYNSIELLRKSGFVHLILSKVHGTNCGHVVNFRGKELRKILKMDGGEIKYFRDKDINSSELETYQFYKKQGVRLNINEIEVAEHMYKGEIDRLMSIVKVDICKVIKYLTKQNYDEKGERIRHNRISDYRDYIRDCIKLGMDIRKNKVLYPEEFHKTHMRLIEMIAENETKVIREAFVRNVENYFSLNGIEKIYSDENFIMRPAMDPSELYEESSNLGHCVKSYAERVSEGECIIIFVRKIDEPNKSYYTLELQGKKIIQCRGKGNCGMTDEIKAFVEKWHKEVVMKKDKKLKVKQKSKKVKVKAVA